MFRPTQTTPIALTAVSIVVGIMLTVVLVVIALLNTVEPVVLEIVGAHSSEHSGVMFFTAMVILIAAIRPLAGGIALTIMAVLTFPMLPVVAIVGGAYALMCFLRALMSRRYLAEKN